MRQVPLTVLTVHQAIRGYYGSVAAVYPEDQARTEDARVAAQAETEKMLAGLEGPRPEPVTVTAVHGFPVEELIMAGKDADMIASNSASASPNEVSIRHATPGIRERISRPADHLDVRLVKD